MKKIRPVLSLVIVMLSAGILISAENKMRVNLEEVLSVGSLNDDTLFMWVDIEAVPGKGFYVTDTMDYSIKHFSAQGELIKKQGRKGQGPGEFLAPRSLEMTDDYIYVMDQYLNGIHMFERDGLNFAKIIPFRNPITDFKVISDDRIAVIPTSMHSVGKIQIIDSEGEKISSFIYWDSGRIALLDAVNFDIDRDGNIYMAYNFQDRIEKFNSEGKKIWSTSLLGKKKIEKEKVDRVTVPTEIVFLSLDRDAQGRIYVLGGDLSKNPRRDIYILSPSGERIGTVTLPESSHCIYIDAENHLYARGNAGVTIKKYRMTFE